MITCNTESICFKKNKKTEADEFDGEDDLVDANVPLTNGDDEGVDAPSSDDEVKGETRDFGQAFDGEKGMQITKQGYSNNTSLCDVYRTRNCELPFPLLSGGCLFDKILCA